MIFETFSQRKRKLLRSAEPEVFSYDIASPELRHQICAALHDGIGTFHIYNNYQIYEVPSANSIWDKIDRVCFKEIYEYLGYIKNEDVSQRFFKFLLNAQHVDNFLSGVEIGCRFLSISTGHPSHRGATMDGEAAIEEINARFLQHAVGYKFENSQILRIDSEFVHAEVIKPALKLLSQAQFAAANAEFMAAHKHYRGGMFKDAVTAANRAFESTLKIICDSKYWDYNKGDRASELVSVVFNKGLFSHNFDRSFGAYIAMLKSGLPNVRNDAGAHGDGKNASPVSASIAQFAINMTATNICLLVQAYENVA